MNKFFYVLAIGFIISITIFATLKDRGNKFLNCTTPDFSDTACDSCALKYTPYLIVTDDVVIINLTNN